MRISVLLEYVKDRTFHLSTDTWVDSRFREGMREVTVIFNSDEYFKLLDDSPDVAPYFSVGPKCVVVSGDMAYRITED